MAEHFKYNCMRVVALQFMERKYCFSFGPLNWASFPRQYFFQLACILLDCRKDTRTVSRASIEVGGAAGSLDVVSSFSMAAKRGVFRI